MKLPKGFPRCTILIVSVGDRSWLRASDGVVRQMLQKELARLDGADPFACLGLPRTAKDADVRAAFLEATKTFHPNRFARRDEAIRRLANEVFLAINKAHSRLSSADARKKTEERIKAGRAGITTQLPIPVSKAGEVLKAPTSPRTRGAAAPSRPKAARRPAGDVVSRAASARAKRETGAGVSTTVAFKKKSPGTSQSEPETAGAAKPKPRSRPMSVDEMRRQRRKERMASQRRSKTPTPIPVAKKPATRDPASVTAQIQDREEKRKEAFRAATALLRQGQLSSAKEMFRQLAIENPNERRYRVLMHYTWGRELHAAGRDEEALAEYNRALGLDPAFEPALKSVASLRLDGGKKQPGLLSKFFGKE